MNEVGLLQRANSFTLNIIAIKTKLFQFNFFKHVIMLLCW